MPRPKGSSTKSYKLIFKSLSDEPKNYSEIIKETGLHRNTVADRLKYLTDSGLVRKYKFGKYMMYEIIKSEPPVIGWEIPWIDLMMTEGNYKDMYRKIDEKIKLFQFKQEINQIALELCRKYADAPENQEFIEILKEVNVDFTCKELLNNIYVPYCLDCLKSEGKKISAIEKGGDIICPNCGLVISRELFDPEHDYLKLLSSTLP